MMSADRTISEIIIDPPDGVALGMLRGIVTTALLHCRIGRRVGLGLWPGSDRAGEFGERRGNPQSGWDVESEFVGRRCVD